MSFLIDVQLPFAPVPDRKDHSDQYTAAYDDDMEVMLVEERAPTVSARRSADASSGVNRKSPSLMPKAWVTWTAPSGQLVEDRTGNARGGQHPGAEPGDGVVEGRVRQVFPG